MRTVGRVHLPHRAGGRVDQAAMEDAGMEADGRIQAEDVEAEAAEDQPPDIMGPPTHGLLRNGKQRVSAAIVGSVATGGESAPSGTPPWESKKHNNRQCQPPQSAEKLQQLVHHQPLQQLRRREMDSGSRGGGSTVDGPSMPRPED